MNEEEIGYKLRYWYWDNVKKENAEAYEIFHQETEIDVEFIVECGDLAELQKAIIEEIDDLLQELVENSSRYGWELNSEDLDRIEKYCCTLWEC